MTIGIDAANNAGDDNESTVTIDSGSGSNTGGSQPLNWNTEKKGGSDSIQISTNPTEEKAPDKQTVKIQKPDYLKDYVAKSAVVSEAPRVDTIKEGATNLSVDDYKAKLDREEAESAKEFTVEDFYDMAELAIEGIDLLFTFFLRWYAKDNKDAPYSLNDTKKKKLSGLMVKILIKIDIKFPVGIMFIFALGFAYMTPLREARKTRKKWIEDNTPTEDGKGVVVTDTTTGKSVKSPLKPKAKPKRPRTDKPAPKESTNTDDTGKVVEPPKKDEKKSSIKKKAAPKVDAPAITGK